MIGKLAVVVMILGLVGVSLGAVFVWQGIEKNNLIVDRMKIEQVALTLDPDKPEDLMQVTDATSAQQAADITASHRRAIASSYQALLGGGILARPIRSN